MIVYIARHAWAGNYGDPPPPGAPWRDDSERPLTSEGVARCRRMVGLLADRGFAPERIATSPFTRCVQTAELIAEAVTGVDDAAPPVDELEALAIGADLAPLVAWSAATNVDQVAWVGHNPDVARLTAWLVGDGHASLRFAKGSIAAVRFDGPPAAGGGELLWHVTAKVLGV